MNNQLLERVINAHGGSKRWQEIESIQLRLNIFGPILITRFKSPWLSNISACVYTEKPYVSFHDFPGQGMTGIYDAYSVYIYDENDMVSSERDFNLKVNRRDKARLHWDHLDLIFYLGKAVWNYICCPFVLDGYMIDCYAGKVLIDADGKRFDTLNISFPSSIPSQTKQQILYFSEDGLLRRSDHIGAPFCPVSIGSDYFQQYETVEGISFPTRKTLFPRLWNGRALKPVVVMDGFINEISINWKSAI